MGFCELKRSETERKELEKTPCSQKKTSVMSRWSGGRMERSGMKGGSTLLFEDYLKKILKSF